MVSASAVVATADVADRGLDPGVGQMLGMTSDLPDEVGHWVRALNSIVEEHHAA